MNARQGGEDRNGSDQDSYPECPAIEPLPAPSPTERLEYIADMLQELRIMSKQADCTVLATLIERAHREAARQTRISR